MHIRSIKQPYQYAKACCGGAYVDMQSLGAQIFKKQPEASQG